MRISHYFHIRDLFGRNVVRLGEFYDDATTEGFVSCIEMVLLVFNAYQLCKSFNAKSSVYVYIKYIICKHLIDFIGGVLMVLWLKRWTAEL